MNLKKLLAGTLAAAMIISVMPMTSFAKTKNHVNKVPVVADDKNFAEDGDAPILTIEQDPDAIAGETFKLNFENAEWKAGKVNEEIIVTDENLLGNVEKYTYKKLTDTSVEITVGDKKGDGDQQIKIPMLAEMGDAGEAKVTVDRVDSTLSAGTYTFAIAGEGDTIMKIEKAEKIDDNGDIKPITIEETKIGAISVKDGKVQTFKLKLPSHFSWGKAAKDTKDSDMVVFSGGLSKAELKGIAFNDRELEVSFIANSKRSSRGTITVDNVRVLADSDANFGEVDVKISGDEFTAQTITVANYVDYGLTIEADGEPKSLIAGRWEVSNTEAGDKQKVNDKDTTYLPDKDDVFKLQKLIIKEDIENSWLADRKTKIEFPNGVKIVDYEIKKESHITLGSITKDDDCQYIEFSGDVENKEKAEVNITFYVSVEPDFAGDIVATLSGRGLPKDETEVVLGKATAPITAEVDVKDVRIGRQSQEIGTITIAETEAEAIKKGDLVVTLDKSFEWAGDPEVEVTEGDLEIKDVATDKNVLTIEVDGDSRTATTIKITNGKVDLDRTLPEGEFKVEIGGDAIVQNSEKETNLDKDEAPSFDKNYVVKTVFANVVTPNTDDLAKSKISGQKAAFTVGSTDYTVGEEAAAADAAPYIKDGRTMIPVKYAAYALGVDPSNVKWDQATKTVTILGDRVIQIKIGSKDLTVNGAVLTMDVAAEVVDGRSYLPISWIASALNVPYSWDAETKTVTFN